ncbi:hypothetical protein HYV86_04635 [Candidatus Woesearchaeota archaeon]|nr:hypothetical protein [Candidatus Woesearchaeota archaeon]
MNKRDVLVNLVRGILEDWNKAGVCYCVLRNYEFLYDVSASRGNDLDLVVAAKDFSRATIVLEKYGFVAYPTQFSRQHKGYGIYIQSIHEKFGFDIQIGGIHWNDMCYLPAELLLSHRIKKEFFFIPSNEDALVMYLCHSLLGKRFVKEKYQQRIKELAGHKLNWEYVQQRLFPVFGTRTASRFVSSLKVHHYQLLEHKGWGYALWFILRSARRWWTMSLLSLRWLRWKRFFHSYPLIAFIGPDGSGKSSNAQQMYELLSKTRKVSLVYTGRGKNNILPIKRLAGVYKKKEGKQGLSTENAVGEKKGTVLQRLLYGLAAPVYTLDLLLRYLLVIFPKRKCKQIVITDRYASDIFVMPHVPLWEKKILLWFVPKPTLTFYLYNDASVLFERRKQQSVAELERQMKLYSVLVRKFEGISIKTTDVDTDFATMEKAVWEYFLRKRY